MRLKYHIARNIPVDVNSSFFIAVKSQSTSLICGEKYFLRAEILEGCLLGTFPAQSQSRKTLPHNQEVGEYGSLQDNGCVSWIDLAYSSSHNRARAAGLNLTYSHFTKAALSARPETLQSRWRPVAPSEAESISELWHRLLCMALPSLTDISFQ